MEEVSNALAAFSSEQMMVPAAVEDIDQNDHDNPQLCSVYVNDIYKYLRHLEVRSHGRDRLQRSC